MSVGDHDTTAWMMSDAGQGFSSSGVVGQPAGEMLPPGFDLILRGPGLDYAAGDIEHRFGSYCVEGCGFFATGHDPVDGAACAISSIIDHPDCTNIGGMRARWVATEGSESLQ